MSNKNRKRNNNLVSFLNFRLERGVKMYAHQKKKSINLKE